MSFPFAGSGRARHAAAEPHRLPVPHQPTIHLDRGRRRYPQAEPRGRGSDPPRAGITEQRCPGCGSRAGRSGTGRRVPSSPGRSEGCAVGVRLQRFDRRRLDGLPVGVGQPSGQPNRASEGRDDGRVEPHSRAASAATDARGNAHPKSRVDPGRESQRCGGAVCPPARGGLVSRLVDRAGAELVRATAKALVIHVRDELRALDARSRARAMCGRRPRASRSRPRRYRSAGRLR